MTTKGGPDRVRAAREAEFPVERDRIFLNAASSGLLPRSAAEASAELTLRRNRPGGVDDAELGAVLRRCRRGAAALLAVDEEEITLAPNTSYGVNLGAALVAAGEPGTVVVPAGEFPANVYPWMALRERGFRVEVVPSDDEGRPDPTRLMDALDGPDVRALALSAVQFASGYRADLAAFGRACRERDILFLVDAIQALGAVELHPRALGVDLLATGGQKWLCAPWGSGFTWIDRRHHDRFDPPMVSWLSQEAALDFTDVLGYEWGFLDDGRKFELATLGIQDYLALARSLELFLEMGMGAVTGWLRTLQAPLLAWAAGREAVTPVTPADEARRAGIVALRTPDPAAVAAELGERGVILSVREGALRIAPHWYNTLEEIERVVAYLDELVPEAAPAG